MSTRRDRAARAVADAIWGDEFAGAWLADERAEAYRIVDHVLAEADRIPDVSEMDEPVRQPHQLWHQTGPDEAHERWRCTPYKCGWAPALRTGGGVVCGAASPPLNEEQAREAASPLTDGGAATPPADPAEAPSATGGDQAAESATGAANTGRVPSSVLPRPFLLIRKIDVTGLSGTGVVAWGTAWPDNTVSLRWATKHKSTVHWDNVDDLLAVHGHDGATLIRWLNVSLHGGAF